MSQTAINESIDVIAKFSKGNIIPLVFKYESRTLKIDSVDLKYDFHRDSVKFSIFSVSSGANSYKISYNSRTYQWTLEEIFTADN